MATDAADTSQSRDDQNDQSPDEQDEDETLSLDADGEAMDDEADLSRDHSDQSHDEVDNNSPSCDDQSNQSHHKEAASDQSHDEEDLSREHSDQSHDEENLSREQEGGAMDDEAEDGRSLSHQDAMNLYQKNLAAIIQDDPLLCDLASTATLEEVKSRIALEHGQAITINVVKVDGQVMPVVVVQNGTLLDLKRAIRAHVTLHLERNAIDKPISWRYIWRTYWLYFDAKKMEDDNKKLKDYGIYNKAEVTFIKRLRKR